MEPAVANPDHIVGIGEAFVDAAIGPTPIAILPLCADARGQSAAELLFGRMDQPTAAARRLIVRPDKVIPAHTWCTPDDCKTNLLETPCPSTYT